MEFKDNKVEDVDPDYKINTTALRKIKEKEEEETKFTSEKISQIITEEFDKEICFRQKQLEEIEDKICKAQKLLHLIRYVLITSYYNKKGLEYDNSSAESNSTSNFDVQSRIHPAVKKLLGKNASLEVLNARGKRRASSKNNYSSEYLSNLSATKKLKLEPSYCESSIKPQTTDNDNNQNLQKNRKKTKYRIVVGNISKWMPSLDNDNTTHKWMVYVRGIKEAVDISCVVSKVIFYLHPSYRPHDVVEISTYPFHLSRRGWGEFPLRVQIFFKSPLNKPVSIVHNLKLDKTYTGRQTLGNETIVDIYLHDDDISQEREKANQNTETVTQKEVETFKTFPKVEDIKQIEEESPVPLDPIKLEPARIKTEYNTLTDLSSTSFEHNYCYEEEVVEDKVALDNSYITSDSYYLFDHTYSRPSNEYKELDTTCVKNYSTIANEEPSNSLIYGLGESYTENGERIGNIKRENMVVPIDKCVVKTFTTATGQPIRFLPQSFNKVLLSNGNIIQIKVVKPMQSPPKKINCDSVPQLDVNMEPENKIIDYEKYKVSLPKKRFRNIGQVLPYLFKRLPLWSQLANEDDFKCTYPFIAASKAEFLSWNVGKQINSEWCRAKAIKNILSREIFPDLEKWSTRTFFMYARSHGYSDLIKCGTLFRQHSVELQLLEACFSKSLLHNKFSLECSTNDDPIIDINEVFDDNLPLERNRLIDISNTKLKNHCAFVKESALDCGVILKSEEISEGVVMNAAERIILEAVKCLAEGLIRRSRHHLVCTEDYSETSEITAREMTIALNERPEIKSIINFQERKREMDFFL